MNNPVMRMEVSPALLRTAHIVYALHAAGLALGAFGAATVIGSFLFGWPSIIAVIVNYIYRGSARGTWLESHFDWQIRTFWYAMAWTLLVAFTGLILSWLLIGFAVWTVGFIVMGIWVGYRIVRGWIRLSNAQPMPVN